LCRSPKTSDLHCRSSVMSPVCVCVRSHLWVVHEPHQAALRCVQDEVAAQELAAALILLYVQEATDAVPAVDVRHLWARAFHWGWRTRERMSVIEIERER